MVADPVCPLCRGILVVDATRASCERCGNYPRIGGAFVLVPQPSVAILRVRDEAMSRFAKLESVRESIHEATSRLGDERDRLDALVVNQELFEANMQPALAAARGQPPLRGLAPLLEARGSAFDEVLRYFYEDWALPRSPIRDRIVGEIGRHAPRAMNALVIGSGAGGLVGDLSAHVESVVGVDLSLSSVLLAERLLEGDSVECHLDMGNWRRVTLQGHRARGRVDLVCADGTALPWKDESFDVVVTQYILDIVPDAESIMREVNRVLVQGGIWINDGLPFRLRDLPEGARLIQGDRFARVAELNGFRSLSVERRSHPFLDTQALDPWEARIVHEVMHTVSTKVSTVEASIEESALYRYFGGDSSALFRLCPALDCDVSITRKPFKIGLSETIRVGSQTIGAASTTSREFLLRFLGWLDGTRTVETVLEEMSPASLFEERDTVMAIDVLRRGAKLRLR